MGAVTKAAFLFLAYSSNERLVEEGKAISKEELQQLKVYKKGIKMDYIKHLRSMVGQEKVIMVVAGAFVFDEGNCLLLQQRTDNRQWGLPGGFMELGEKVQDTARREVFEETGIKLEKLELFGIYSGPEYDKTFSNGDQVSMVQIIFSCKQYKGALVEDNEESLKNRFFDLNNLPENIFAEHRVFLDDLLSNKEQPIIK
jgi:ADP-ribose pyrophosphatase YjhB (NUDIX family)